MNIFFIFLFGSENEVKTADLTEVSRSIILSPALHEAGVETCRGGTENPWQPARHLFIILVPALCSGYYFHCAGEGAETQQN